MLTYKEVEAFVEEAKKRERAGTDQHACSYGSVGKSAE